MQLTSLQQQLVSKYQRQQTKTATKSSKTRASKPNRNSITSSLSSCVRGLASVSKAFNRTKPKNTVVPSISSSSVSSQMCYINEYSRSTSTPLSAKSLALESLIFDHPSVTIHIQPISCRAF
ncbi:hypothetical protein CLU79DRAFT_841924 [Phycomyces nitens]|nr:hypothetical protein CLU79DRAFT_841924 [Phycomyces nitens]